MDGICPSNGCGWVLAWHHCQALGLERCMVKSNYNIELYSLIKVLSLRERGSIPTHFSLLKFVIVPENLNIGPFLWLMLAIILLLKIA